MAIETEVFTTEAWSAATMKQELGHPNAYYVVAVAPNLAGAGTGECIVAYAGLMVLGDVADIQTIAVAPTARGHSLGRRLMHTLLQEAWRRGATQVFLEVKSNNAVAQRLYRSLGFQRIAVRKAYYCPEVDALVMRLSRQEESK